jgi:hypothetical protein
MNGPFYVPGAHLRVRTRQPPQPGTEAWRMEKNGRTLRCEIRNDSRRGAAYDVRLLENGKLRTARRCVNASNAEYVAESYRRDLVHTEWTQIATDSAGA